MRKIMRIKFAFILVIAFCFIYALLAMADSSNLDTKDWDNKCLQKNKEELGSLVDPGADDSPSLPVGNPFNVISDTGTGYWSRSTVTGHQSNAWRYGFNLGSAVGTPKDREGLRWCVRGGFAHDAFSE